MLKEPTHDGHSGVQILLQRLEETREPTRAKRNGYAADPDTDLVAALKVRDPRAFDSLVARYETRLLRLAQRVTKNWEDAEDSVQDSFVKVYKHIDRFRGDSQFSTWLTRITLNQALMKLRRRTHTLISFEDYMVGDGIGGMKEFEVEYSPEDLYLQQEFEITLHTLAHRVRKSSRKVFNLHVTNEMSSTEIAHRLGISVASVKSRLSRARNDLRRSGSVYFPAEIAVRKPKKRPATIVKQRDTEQPEVASLVAESVQASGDRSICDLAGANREAAA